MIDRRTTSSLAIVALTFTLGLLALLGLVTWSPVSNVMAAGAVGTGTAASCTEAALNTALVGGGLVTFNCGADPVTITLTTTKQITLATTIDGGGKVALSGGGVIQVISNALSNTLTLQNITVTRGFTQSSGGGVFNFGNLVLSNTAFVSNTAASGGGVYSAGPMTVTNSLFASNVATDGVGAGIAQILRPIIVRGSTFISNSSSGTGGALATIIATTTVASTDFFSNTATAGVGGLVGLISPMQVDGSRFIGNQVLGPVGNGVGAMYAALAPEVAIRDSLFLNNVATGTMSTGGFNSIISGKTSIARSTFSGNSAGGDGVGGIRTLLDLNITVEDSTFSANSVVTGVGGLHIQSAVTATAELRNNTFSGNNGGVNGVGAILGNFGMTNAVTLTHNTIVSNTTTGTGSAISATAGTTMTVRNSIIANNVGTNCAPGAALVFTGFNIQNGDASCPGVAQVDPRVGPLRDNGGPVQTHALLAGSPAINSGVALYCPPADARGAPRPSGSGCDTGAFELSVPTLTSISPTTTVVSLISLPIQLTGTNFITGATALVDGSPRATSFISSTRLSATLVPTDTMTARTLAISVRSPGEGEGPTGSLPLSVTTNLFVPTAATSYISNW